MDDWEAFRAAHKGAEPTTLRIRAGRVSEGELLTALSRRGFDLAPIPSVEGFHRVENAPYSVAQTPEHWLGLFHVQQAVMGLPTLALTPRSGERILDLCAAPGGKTAHMAELMSDRGPLVAVDPQEKRLRALLSNLYRLAHPNVLVIAGDGRTLPDTARFDRILVDAPCSAEGNYRRRRGRMVSRKRGFVDHITSLQEALLRRAVHLARPGGVIVYSTCTYAPEENEAVVDRVLRDEPVESEEIPLEAPHASGIMEWNGTRFHRDVSRAWRVYPHHLDSGGLFMLRLRKLGPSTPDDGSGWSPVPAAFPGEDRQAATKRIEVALSGLRSRLGLPDKLLTELGWMARKENIWAHTAERWPVESWAEASTGGANGGAGERRGREGWRVVTVGLRALRRGPGKWETPTNHFLGRWGKHLAPERQVALHRSELRTLLEGTALPAEGRPAGPVALLWEGRVIGRGIVGRTGLTHQIARAYADRLRAILDHEQGDEHHGDEPA